jgi:ADP-heptose:LPS heptosyltransferase
VHKDQLQYLVSYLCSKFINLFKKPVPYDYKRILVVRLDEIGDMATSLHVFPLLSESYPQAEITLWCKPFIKELMAADPNIDKMVTSREELNGRYDLIVDLRSSWRSIKYAFTHRPRYRVDRWTIRMRNKIAGGHPHEVYTNLQIIAGLLKNPEPGPPKLKLHLTEQDRQKARSFISENGIVSYAVFHTGARRELRKWPDQNFAAIASYLKNNKGWDIVFTGDKSDVEQISRIQSLIPFRTYNTAGDMSLREFAALTAGAQLFIGNESGPMHLATAVDAPVIGLFGPGVPVIFYPYGEKTAYLHHVLHCNPCDQVHCVHPENPCIGRIEVSEVAMKIEQLTVPVAY